MVKIEVLNKKYHMPTSLSETPIRMFQDVVTLISSKENYKDERDKEVKIISLMSGIPEGLLMKIKGKDFVLLRDKARYVFNEENQKGLQLQYTLNIDGIEYGFDSLLSDFPASQFIVGENLTEDPTNVNDNIHLIMAMLYRPIKKISEETLFHYIFRLIWCWMKLTWKFPQRKVETILEEYDAESAIQRAELFREKIMMDKVFTPVFFFTSLRMTLIQNTKDYLSNPMLKKLLKVTGKLIQKTGLNRSGVGGI